MLRLDEGGCFDDIESMPTARQHDRVAGRELDGRHVRLRLVVDVKPNTADLHVNELLRPTDLPGLLEM